MKIILRQCTTGLWLKPCGRWEANSVNAREFASGAEAIQCSNDSHLADLQVCFRFEDPNLNFELNDRRRDEREAHSPARNIRQ